MVCSAAANSRTLAAKAARRTSSPLSSGMLRRTNNLPAVPGSDALTTVTFRSNGSPSTSHTWLPSTCLGRTAVNQILQAAANVGPVHAFWNRTDLEDEIDHPTAFGEISAAVQSTSRHQERHCVGAISGKRLQQRGFDGHDTARRISRKRIDSLLVSPIEIWPRDNLVRLPTRMAGGASV